MINLFARTTQTARLFRGEKCIFEQLIVAKNWFTRARGLLNRKTLQNSEALLISPCNSIHTIFMKFSIDVIFLDRDLKIKKIVTNVKPWRAAWCFGAKKVLEAKAGAVQCYGLAVGDFFEIKGDIA